ncbi:MAG: hypothetical protein AAB288_14675, partial [Acidobacteriota bacterium]
MTTSRTMEVNSVAVHPDEPKRVFIGTNNYGVLVSNDGGRNFVPTNDNFTSRFTYSVTPDRTQPNRLYATTKNTSTSGGFFFSSSDGGATWTQAKGLDINRDSSYSVLQDRVDPNKIYMGSGSGIFRSLDRGLSWTLVAAKPPAKVPAKRAPVKKGAIAAKAKAKPATPGTVLEKGQELIPALKEKVTVLSHTEDDKNGILAG